jgi:hypothetical protein
MTRESPLETIIELNFRVQVPDLIAAAKELGGISVRVVDDTEEALGLFRAQVVARSRLGSPEASEEGLAYLAALTWTEQRVAQFIGSGTVHAVTEITFYRDHSLAVLHDTAEHGGTFGRT